MLATAKINPTAFYGQWAGHPLSDLSTIHTLIRSNRPQKRIIFLAGDSSLDNKAWVPSNLPVSISPFKDPQHDLPTTPNIYTSFLDPPDPTLDVAFWLNHCLGDTATALNTAVEASTLRDREKELLPHDIFIREHIRPEDVLIVSVGANDIALKPTASTMRHMMQLAWLTSRSSIEAGTASSLKYFKELFLDQTRDYILRLVEKQKPRAVVVCMIYFPLEFNTSVSASATTTTSISMGTAANQTSWADPQLKILGYNRDPGQLQAAIRKMYEQATTGIKIEGTRVVPCKLYEVLDGKRSEEYTARVEPSVEGGRKMAEIFARLVEEVVSDKGRTDDERVEEQQVPEQVSREL